MISVESANGARGPILITGGTGHTGRRLVKHLIERGESLRILTREPARLAVELRRQAQIYRGDLEDQAFATEACSGCSAVIALTHIRFAPQLLDAMRLAQVRRAIFMSSTRRFTRYPELTARQVIEGEAAVENSGLDWTIIRCSMIYGGRQDRNLEQLVTALRKWPLHPLPSGGAMKWQPVYTWDVVAALTAALDKTSTIGKAYTVAGPEPITYKQMVQTILREAKLRRLLLPVPLGPLRLLVQLHEKTSRRPLFRSDQVERLQEDKTFDVEEAVRDLGITLTPFPEGIRQKLSGRA